MIKTNTVIDNERHPIYEPMASAAPNLHPEACFDRTRTNEGGGPAGAPFGPLHLSHLRLGNMHSKWNGEKISHWV